MRIISNLGIKFNIIEDNFNIYENGIKYLPFSFVIEPCHTVADCSNKLRINRT